MNVILATLKKAKAVFPEVVNKTFLESYVREGLISEKEAEAILK
jgi:hypothetical protein